MLLTITLIDARSLAILRICGDASCSEEVKLDSEDVRFSIARYSPGQIEEVGPPSWVPEKNLVTRASPYGAVHFLRSDLSSRNREERACFPDFVRNKGGNSLLSRLAGGGRGIRTPGTVSRTSVFKTDCFNHSHIPPRGWQ
jgi:hypothetical protein